MITDRLHKDIAAARSKRPETRPVDRDDIDINRLVLDVVKGGVSDVDVASLLLDARIKDSMSTAPTLTLTIHDPDRKLTNSKRLYYEDKKGDRQVRAIDVELEKGLWYRLVRIRTTPSSSGRGVDLKMEFEHRIISYMRAHNRPRKASRSKMTRAQFILMLLREIKAERIIFRCPELNKKQPLAAASDKEQETRTKREKEKEEVSDIRDRLGDLGDEPSKSVTVKGVPATRRQKDILDQAVTIGEDLNAPSRAVIACVAALITESKASNLAGGDSTSTGPLQLLAKTAKNMRVNARDVPAVIRLFYTKGYWGKGGAIELARKNPTMGIHMIAQNVQGSGTSDGSNYKAWVDEAKSIVRAFAGTGGESTSDSGARYYYKTFNYTRGIDGKKENTYQCSDRLAKEVNWRLFVVGKKTVVYQSEPSLFKQRPRMTITPTHPAVMSGSGDADVNKKVKTFRCEVRMKRWAARPGSIVIVDGWGVHDGRYLVDEIDRSLFSPLATVLLKKPENPKREPRPEQAARDSGEGGVGGLGGEDLLGDGSKGSAAQLYREATRISDLGLPYLYGGGHGREFEDMMNSGGPTGRGSLSGGLDCSSSTSLALWRAGIFRLNGRGPQGLPGGPGREGTMPIVSGQFDQWGEAGRGKYFTVWYNATHVWTEFHNMGRYKRFDTSPYGSGGRGPRMRTKDRPNDGFKARHWPGL